MKVERLSWSDIDALSICGQRYKYARLDRIVLPPGVSMIRGKATHKPIEADLAHKMETGELLPDEHVSAIASDYVDGALAGEVLIDGDYEGMSIAEVKGVVKDEAVSLATVHHQAIAPSIDPTGIELKVEIPPSEALPATYVGVLDVIDGALIRDTKTKRKAPSKSQADTSDQLTGYELLYRALYGEPSAGQALDVLWKTPGRGDVKHATLATTRTTSDLGVFVNRANAARQTIEAELFLPAPADAWVCTPKYCGYTDVCPYYRGRPRPTS